MPPPRLPGGFEETQGEHILTSYEFLWEHPFGR